MSFSNAVPMDKNSLFRKIERLSLWLWLIYVKLPLPDKLHFAMIEYITCIMKNKITTNVYLLWVTHLNRYVCNYWHLGTNWKRLMFEMCTELKIITTRSRPQLCCAVYTHTYQTRHDNEISGAHVYIYRSCVRRWNAYTLTHR